jgi:hypothetical protein
MRFRPNEVSLLATAIFHSGAQDRVWFCTIQTRMISR